jgi:hypothetical protein
MTAQTETHFEEFWDALGLADEGHVGEPHLYEEEQARALHTALVADGGADIVQLSCQICGLPEWRQDHSDLVRDLAAESDDPRAPDPNDAAAVAQWYMESHRCEYYSDFSEPAFSAHRDRERDSAWMAEIREALKPG